MLPHKPEECPFHLSSGSGWHWEGKLPNNTAWTLIQQTIIWLFIIASHAIKLSTILLSVCVCVCLSSPHGYRCESKEKSDPWWQPCPPLWSQMYRLYRFQLPSFAPFKCNTQSRYSRAMRTSSLAMITHGEDGWSIPFIWWIWFPQSRETLI